MLLNRKHPLAKCEKCPLVNERFVPSCGPQGAALAVVGQAPGYQETVYGQPFVGPSGKLLAEVLTRVGIQLDDTFRTNVVLCRAANEEKPEKEAIAACKPRLLEELSVSGCSTVLATGGIAAKTLLQSSDGILKLRVGPPRSSPHDSRIRIVPTVHPAFVLRSSDAFPFLVTDIQKIRAEVREFTAPEYTVLESVEDAVREFDQFPSGLPIAVDIETKVEKDAGFEHASQYELLCVGLSNGSRTVVLPGELLLSPSVEEALGDCLRRSRVIAQNGKFDVPALWRFCPDLRLWFDTMLASYALDERGGIHSLDYLAREHLGAPNWKADIKQYTKGSGDYARIPRDVLHRYNAYDVTCTYWLYELLSSQLEDRGLRHLHDFLVRASNALMNVEDEGVAIDLAHLEQLDRDFGARISTLEAQLSQWVANPRSWKQVQATLNSFGINTPSTDVSHLSQIQERMGQLIDAGRYVEKAQVVLEFTNTLLAHRSWEKLQGTYTQGLIKRLHNGRIHTTYKQHAVVTGRLSSANPNVQNIPYRSDEGRKIRSAFVASDEDHTLITSDFAQGELRVITVLAGIPQWEQAFREGRSPIRELAPQLFGPNYTKSQYVRTKNVLYGCVPLDAEILTKRGWLKWNDIKENDETLGYNPETKHQEWTPILEGFYYKDAPLIELKNSTTWRAVTTPEHRWPAYMRRFDRTKPELFKFYTTDAIPGDCKIVLSAKADTNADTDLTTDEVAILAWLHTDGTIKISPITGAASQGIGGWRRQVFGSICQSKPEGVKVLDALLTNIPHTRDIRAAVAGQRNPMNVYRLSAPWLREVWKRARLHERSLEDFVLNLSTGQREAFLKAAYEAEGHYNNAPIIGQNLGPVRDAIRLAAYMQGYFVRSNKELAPSGKIHDRMRLTRGHVTGQKLVRRNIQRADAWCVRTGLGTWTMKYDDQVMLTGNSTYGMILGRGKEGIKYARDELKMSNDAAFQLQRKLFDVVPELEQWQERTRRFVKAGNTLKTYKGRSRHFWLITKENEKDILNEALAFVPQSTLSDICLTGATTLIEQGIKLRILVHDEIVVECERSRVAETQAAITRAMADAALEFTDKLPFPIEFGVGQAWEKP